MDRNRNKRGELRNESSSKVWRVVAVAASLILYASGFVPLYRQLHQVTGALSMFPVALAGVLFGLRGGMSIGVLVIFLNFYLFSLVTPQGWGEFLSSAPAHLAALLVGGLTGWLSELLHRVKTQARELTRERKVLRDQIEEHHQSESELQKLHVELEQRVIERTARLQSANEALRDREALLRSVLDNIPQSVFWKDRDFVYLGCNNVFASAAAVGSPDQVIGKTDHDLHWRESAEGFHAVDHSVMESNTADCNRVEPQHMPNGEELWFETTKVPMHDAHGRVIGILGTSQDITERRRAEEATRFLAHTLESASEIVTITDLEDRITFVNEAFVRTYGYQRSEAIGRHIDMLWSPNNPPELMEEILTVNRTGPWKGEILNLTKDGRELPISLHTSLVWDERGEMIGLVGISEDITERKQVEEALRESERRYQRLRKFLP